jgi:hypothetical protein
MEGMVMNLIKLHYFGDGEEWFNVDHIVRFYEEDHRGVRCTRIILSNSVEIDLDSGALVLESPAEIEALINKIDR